MTMILKEKLGITLLVLKSLGLGQVLGLKLKVLVLILPWSLFRSSENGLYKNVLLTSLDC